MDKVFSSDIVNLLKDVVIGLIVFFIIFIITIYASAFFNFLINQKNLYDSIFIYYLYSGIKYLLVTLEAIALIAFLLSQVIKFLRELKFLCKDFKNE